MWQSDIFRMTIILLTLILITNTLHRMSRRLQAELRQSKPFGSLEEEVYLELQLTAQVAARWVAEALKPSGLTATQFNVLRILRGSRPKGLAAGAIGERMVNHDPDLTRLLDRLEAAGLVEKARADEDRRVVMARITEEGLRLVEQASESVGRAIQAPMKSLTASKLEALADLLEEVRGASGRQASPASTGGSRHASRK